MNYYLGFYNDRKIGIIPGKLTEMGVKVSVLCPCEHWRGEGEIRQRDSSKRYAGRFQVNAPTARYSGNHILELTRSGFSGVCRIGDKEYQIVWNRDNVAFDKELEALKHLRMDLEKYSNVDGYNRKFLVLLDQIVLKSDPADDFSVAEEFALVVEYGLKGLPIAVPLGIFRHKNVDYLVEKRYRPVEPELFKSLDDPVLFAELESKWQALVIQLIRCNVAGDFKLGNVLLDEGNEFVLTDFPLKGGISFQNWMERYPQSGYLDFKCRICHYLSFRKRKDEFENSEFKGHFSKFEMLRPVRICERFCSSPEHFLNMRKRVSRIVFGQGVREC